MVEPRLCEVCSSDIPKWKSAGTTVCSIGFKFKRREQKRKEARAKLKEKRESSRSKQNGSVIFHSCIFGGGEGVDPFVPERCNCRKLVSEDQAKSLIARGEALDFETRTPVFADGAIVQIGKLLRTPRSATVEKAHVERLVGITKSKDKTLKQLSLEELQNKVQVDRALLQQEESMRLEIYGELTASARRAWIREVPAEEYDAAERQAWGRALFTNYNDERTPGGIGVDVDPSLWNGEFEKSETELCDDETETEKEEIEESDERTAEEVLVEYEESLNVTP